MSARVARRRALGVAVVILLTTASGCSRNGGSATDGRPKDAGAIPFITVDPSSTSPTDGAILDAQQKLRANTNDDSARLALAEAFLQKSRESGDPTLYGRAAVLLEQAKEGRPDEPGIVIAEGVLALAQHRFEDALGLGRKALKLAPGNVGAQGVIVDALNELGRYDEALEATQEMVDAKPNLASLARVSYARELRGDVEGAVTAMTQAVVAAGGTGENAAFLQVQLGNLLLQTGDIAGAEASYAAAERSFPGFAPAKAGRARALVTTGDPSSAANLLAEVVEALPTAEYAIAHGDALVGSGNDDAADKAYEVVEAIADLYRANGVDVDLELALFAADRSPGSQAVKQARAAVDDRPSIQGHDALAWALFTDDKPDEAWTEAKKALRTGSRDPLLRFHAAAIADARNQRDDAVEHLQVVLDSNPRFSAALAPRVAKLATKLGLTVPPPGGAA